MSYNWDFKKDYIGQYHQWSEVQKGYCKMNLYSGNGLFIALWETKKQYQVGMVAISHEHFKNCLKDGIYNIKDKFILNTNVDGYSLKNVHTISKYGTGYVSIELRTKDNPIKKYYSKVKEENQDD